MQGRWWGQGRALGPEHYEVLEFTLILQKCPGVTGEPFEVTEGTVRSRKGVSAVGAH